VSSWDETQNDETQEPLRFDAKSYLDPYVNPRDVLAAEAAKKKGEAQAPHKIPENPTRDVMLFLIEHAPLPAWQLDVLSIIREEAYYFAPQAQTKIMNEGWASYWHSTIMTNKGATDADIVNFADHHSGTMATSPDRLNPYKIGIELFRDIEDRWNRGRFGREYDECDDLVQKRDWDTGANQGRQKIFEVRRIHNDLTFIDTFLTLDFCRRHKLFSFGYNAGSDVYEIEGREFPKIKQRLLFNLTNMGRPLISLIDANYKNRGELFLEHEYNGVELQMDFARDTLTNLHRLWSRPVHIETVLEGNKTVLSFDGSEHKQEQAKGSG
jgi:stage V sporulation protein R